MRSAQVAALYPHVPLAQGVVAAYDFQSQIGTTVFDVSGNGNTGQWQGTLGSQWGPGKIGGGGVFNGTNNYIVIPAAPILNIRGPVSFSCWVKTTSPLPMVVVGGYDPNSPFAGYGFAVGLGGAGRIAYWGGAAWVSSAATVNDGSWHLACAVVLGTIVQFYKDGATAGSASTTQPSSYNGARAIGATSGGNGNLFANSLDELTIWPRALTPNDISSLYNLGQGKAYPF